jgi:hypothetical protein
MTPPLPPTSIRRCSAQSRSSLLGPDGPAGPPPGQRLRSGVSIGQGGDGENKIRLNKVSTLSGEPRRTGRSPAAQRRPQGVLETAAREPIISAAGKRPLR